MNKKKVPGSKISALIALYLIGSSLVLGSGNRARQDSWIALILSTGLSLLLVWLYSSILRLYPGKNLFDISIEIFGKVLGKILCGVYVIYAIYLGALVFRIFDEFIQLVNLPNTPQIAIMLFSAPLIIWQVKSGLKNLASVSKFLLPILYVFVISTFLLGTKFMSPDNLKPFFNSGPKAISESTFSTLMLPYGETVLCMSFFGEIDKKESPFKILANGVLLAAFILILANLRNLMILGSDTTGMFIFSSYDAVGVISVGDFITRISVLIGINLVLAGVVKIGTALYAATVGVSKILEIDHFLLPAAACGLLMSSISTILYGNLLEGIQWIKYFEIFDIPFQIILPLIILITGKIKLQLSKKRPKIAKAKAAGPNEAAPSASHS